LSEKPSCLRDGVVTATYASGIFRLKDPLQCEYWRQVIKIEGVAGEYQNRALSGGGQESQLFQSRIQEIELGIR